MEYPPILNKSRAFITLRIAPFVSWFTIKSLYILLKNLYMQKNVMQKPKYYGKKLWHIHFICTFANE